MISVAALGRVPMTEVKWSIKAREFANCNCSYGCPCQFNGLPTDGTCRAVVGMQIDTGHHGSTQLDGLKVAAIFIDERANDLQREALLRILSGQDTEPGATVFSVFASTLVKVHEPIFSKIDFEVNIDGRRARLVVPGLIETRGEPILNPVTGN